MPALPIDPAMLDSARRQHAAAADRHAARIASCNHAVRQDLAHGRPPGAAARQLLAEAQALMETLAQMRTVERFAAQVRQPAA